MTCPLLLPPHSDHVVSPSFLGGFPSSRVHFRPISVRLPACHIRFPLFCHIRRRHQSPSLYPITMKLPYLRQFSMVFYHPGHVSNAFCNVLNPMASTFTIVFAFVFAVATVANFILFPTQSYLRHFPIIHHRCGVVLNVFSCTFPLLVTIFESAFIFDIIIIPLPFTIAFLLSLSITSVCDHPYLTATTPTPVSLIGKPGGWFAVPNAESYWPSIEGFPSVY